MDPPEAATQLERSASILARQLAMAKLTGQPLPPAPNGLLEPLPTLEQLQLKAARGSRPRLGRNNTVTSATSSSPLEPPAPPQPSRPRLGRSNTVSEGRPAPTPTPTPADRQAIGANLIRKLSARRAGGGGPTTAATTTAASGGGGRADTSFSAAAATAELPPLPPALPLPPLPFSLSHPSLSPTPSTSSSAPPPPPPTTTTTQPQEDDDQEDREEPVVVSSSLRSGSATSTDTSPSPSSSYIFPPSNNSNHHNPRVTAIMDPRLVRPLATFGIAAVEGVPAPSRVTAVNSEGGGGGEQDPGGYRYRERGSSASSSLVLHQQQRAYADDAQLRRTGSISVSSMLSSPGGTSEEEDGEEEGELSTMGGDMSGGGGDGGFSSSGNQDPTASSRTRTRTRTDRMGSIGLGLGAGAAAGSGGIITGPGFFDHHQFRLSSGSEAPRDDAAAAASDPVGEEGGGTEEGTTPTLAQTSRLEGGGATESTPRLSPPPPVVVGSEDAVSEGAGVGGGGVETTPRLGHHHHHHHEGGSSSVRTRTPTMVGTETETETETPGTATSTATEAPTRGRATPPPPPPASTHSHTSAPSTTSVAGQQHPPPPPPPSSSKPPQRSLALTLSDYHPFGASPHPAGGPLASNISGHYHHPGVSRGGSQTTTPLVPDPISPTSVIPNPMEEAIEFPPPPSSASTGAGDGGGGSPNGTPRIEQKKAATTTTTSANQRDRLLQVPSHADDRREITSSSPARSESARSFRSGVATATVTEEEEDEVADDTRDPGATATSSDYHPSPNLTSTSSAEIERPALMHTSSTDSTASTGAGGGRVTTASLPPFEPRVTRLAAAELPANQILAKLDSILGPEPDQPLQQSSSPSTTGLLDPPPRKLLLSSPVLQVVNANTVKDRYLLLFSDMLMIAKPLIEDHALTGEPILPDLDGHFLVKSVVECKHLKLSAEEDPVEESSSSATAAGGGTKKKHPLLVAFVDRFANDPARAIASLISKGGLANDGPTIANLLYRNTDLNRNQLGAYLSDRHQRHVLRAYIDRFRFAGVRIDDALRLFLMSVRLPFDGGAAADYVIGVLANMWAEANPVTGIDGGVAHGLMTAIMRLSDALHGGDEPGERFFRGSKPSVPPTVDDFIASFRDVDTRSVVPEDLLARIYTAVRRERVENASDNSIFSMTPDIEATIEPAKLPTQLVYRTPSTRFTITIPEPDPKFTIKLQGADLQFDPPVLSFARNAKQSFRVTGTALGVRTMVLIKRGANAPRYQGLPLNKAFSIERGFMQHTFQLSFTNHLDLKRKYMFSCRDAETRSRWLRLLRERIATSAGTPIPATPAQAAANAVAVQVLRDAVLTPDEPGVLSAGTPSPRPNVVAPRFGRPVTPSTPRGRLGTPTRPPTAARSNSISRLYPVLYRQEAESGEKRTAVATTATSGMLTPAASGGGGGKTSTANNSPDPATSELSAARLLHGDFVRSGHELVVTTEQNSLLPLVLTFLNAGLEAAPHPLSLRGSAFQLPPLDGTPTPLPSFVSQP